MSAPGQRYERWEPLSMSPVEGAWQAVYVRDQGADPEVVVEPLIGWAAVRLLLFAEDTGALVADLGTSIEGIVAPTGFGREPTAYPVCAQALGPASYLPPGVPVPGLDEVREAVDRRPARPAVR